MLERTGVKSERVGDKPQGWRGIGGTEGRTPDFPPPLLACDISWCVFFPFLFPRPSILLSCWHSSALLSAPESFCRGNGWQSFTSATQSKTLFRWSEAKSVLLQVLTLGLAVPGNWLVLSQSRRCPLPLSFLPCRV